MRIKFNNQFKEEIIRYVVISILSYAYIFVSLFLMVNFLKINETISFMTVYGIAYLLLYSVQLKYLFKKEHNKHKLIRFCLTLLFFYGLANLIYNICIYNNVNYLISTILTIVLLFPLRFIVYKYFVYK